MAHNGIAQYAGNGTASRSVTASSRAPSDRTERCSQCGRASCVHVLEGYSGQTPVFRSLCLACSENHATPDPVALMRPRLSLSAAVVATGVIVGAGGALADHFGIGGSSGFGMAQSIGVVVGAVCILVGALLRVDMIGILGGILFITSIVADLLSIGGRSGFGWKQTAAVAGGAALTGAGMVWLLFEQRRQRVNPADGVWESGSPPAGAGPM